MAHGSGGSTNLGAQYDDLRQMVAEVPAAPTRLAFVQFAADPFAGDLAGRAALFADRYAACLLHLVIDAAPAPCRPAP